MAGIFSIDAWKKVWTFRDTFLLGLGDTVETAIFGLVISLILGIIFGLMGTSNKKALRIISRVYVEVIQNTPLLLQMCFLYYALAFSGNSIGIIATGITALGIYHGAYTAEVVRAGIESVPKGQFEAAQSQGFGYIQRMYYIILPQSIKVILPPLVNQVVNLIKNTSCLYIVGGTDLISVTYSFVTGASTGLYRQRRTFLYRMFPVVYSGKYLGKFFEEERSESKCGSKIIGEARMIIKGREAWIVYE